MFKWLDNMRRQPLSKRRLVAFSVTLFFTGLLFIVWLTVWLPQFNTENKFAEKNESFSTPTDTFTQNISSAWSNLSSQFFVLKSTVKKINVSDNLSSGVQYTAVSTASTTAKVQPQITIIEVSSTTPEIHD